MITVRKNDPKSIGKGKKILADLLQIEKIYINDLLDSLPAATFEEMQVIMYHHTLTIRTNDIVRALRDKDLDEGKHLLADHIRESLELADVVAGQLGINTDELPPAR